MLMSPTMSDLIIALSGALIAGAINALSGNGSVITLTILTELIGLPGHIANATNRVGVLFNAAGASAGFFRKREIDFKRYLPFIVPVIIGAVAGIIVATMVTHGQFMTVFKILMVVMLFVVIFNPERWLIAQAKTSLLPKWLEWPLMLLLGFYGGFIQMGMGVFYLAVLVLVARLPMVESNTIKALSVGLFTLVAVVIFAAMGMIRWEIGLVMGAGQFIGGWLAAHYVSVIPGSSRVAYGVLLVAVLLSILKLFNVF